MPEYYFSGINQPKLLAILERQKASGMVNALSAGQPALLWAYKKYPEVPLTMDSGAYQGNRNVEEYARLIKRIGWRMHFYASLDVLHNQQASDTHYRQLLTLLSSEKEARDKLLWIYQCQSRGEGWHQGGDLDGLRRTLEFHKFKFIGVGGFTSVIHQDPVLAQDLLATIGEVLESYGAQAHVFGLGSYDLLQFACSQSWFRSADSTRWLLGLSSKLLLTTTGRAISARTFTFSGLACAEQNVGAIKRWLMPGKICQLSLFPEDLPAERRSPPNSSCPHLLLQNSSRNRSLLSQ